MPEQATMRARKVESITGNIEGFFSAVIGRRGDFHIDIISRSDPSISQLKPLGILQLGIKLADSEEKINISLHPVEQITGALDLISKGHRASPSYDNWKKSEKGSPYSYYQIYFFQG